MTQEKSEVNPFKMAYEDALGFLVGFYMEEGRIDHQIFGYTFKDGEIDGVGIFLVEEKHMNDIPNIIQSMLMNHQVIAHCMESWSAPSPEFRPSEHPLRDECLSVILYSDDGAVSAAMCPLNTKSRTIQKGELQAISGLKGRMAREMDVRH